MTCLAIDLPDETGRLVSYTLQATPVAAPAGPRRFNRRAYAAVHVVADPFAAQEPSQSPAIDWEATLAFRRHILDLGLGVAEAMDTAQRGMGLDWPAARELIERSLAAAAPAERERIVSGVGTDHLDPTEARSLDDIVTAYLEQLAAVQNAGGRVVLMASRALARIATGPAITKPSTPACWPRPTRRSSCIGWARCLIRRSPATGGLPTSRPRWRRRSPSSTPTPRRSTASSSPSWTIARSRDAPAPAGRHQDVYG